MGAVGQARGRASTRALLELQKELPAIGDVRGGKGSIAAIELVADRTTKPGLAPDQKIGLRHPARHGEAWLRHPDPEAIRCPTARSPR